MKSFFYAELPLSKIKIIENTEKGQLLTAFIRILNLTIFFNSVATYIIKYHEKKTNSKIYCVAKIENKYTTGTISRKYFIKNIFVKQSCQ